MAKYILKHQVGAECHAVAMALQQPNSTAWKPIHPGALGDPLLLHLDGFQILHT